MNFEKTLKATQMQIAHDKRVFKKTGVMSELLIRIENFNRGAKCLKK